VPVPCSDCPDDDLYPTSAASDVIGSPSLATDIPSDAAELSDSFPPASSSHGAGFNLLNLGQSSGLQLDGSNSDASSKSLDTSILGNDIDSDSTEDQTNSGSANLSANGFPFDLSDEADDISSRNTQASPAIFPFNNMLQPWTTAWTAALTQPTVNQAPGIPRFAFGPGPVMFPNEGQASQPVISYPSSKYIMECDCTQGVCSCSEQNTPM